MLKRALLSVVIVATMPSLSLAQTGFADLIDHIHLAAPDQAKAVEWYHANFGAELTKEGPDRAMLGTTRLIFQKSDTPKPSQGSVLEMIGFSVPDLDGTMKKLQAATVKVVMPAMVMQGVRSAWVMDPWGTLIEVVQDEKKLGLHHIVLSTADPAAELAWFASSFGGKVTKAQGGLDGINYGGVWVLAKKGSTEPSAGHAIDHIGFRPVDVDASVAALKTKNVKVTTEPRPLTLPSGTSMRLAFIEGPGGVRIELVQRDNLK
ncbi:MAG TPA: VOC family protein [Vicinamibacterales bacterium]|jgi:catechol 2,3-dioxygenase-like lactoylglutathione lyase family enzyme